MDLNEVWSLIFHHALVVMALLYAAVCVVNRYLYRGFAVLDRFSVENNPVTGQSVGLRLLINAKARPKLVVLQKSMYDERQPRSHLFAGILKADNLAKSGVNEINGHAVIPANIPPGRWMIVVSMMARPNEWNPLFKLAPVRSTFRAPVEVCQSANPACSVVPEDCPHAKKG